MKLIISNILIGCLLIATSFKMQAQNGPKVGVVLSGGGAKGLAHIGALEVLEEYGIQVDYIAGTSIGALVGGLYATGYSAKQLDSLISKRDLTDIILGEIPRTATDIRRRRYDEKDALTLTFEKGKLDIPSGLSNGQNVYDFLFNSAYPYTELSHFDSLPIPFFCIGTDLLTGEEIILDKGNLPLALRASASLPTILNPVRIGDRIVVDGGVTNNLPAKELRDKGADIVIGISVESGLFKEEELTSVMNILAQVNSYGIVRKSEAQYEHCDLLVKPKVESYGLLSFGSSEDLIEEGRLEMQKLAKQLMKIGKAQHQRTNKRSVGKPKEKKYFKLNGILLKVSDEQDREYIKSYLPFRVGDFIGLEELSYGISALQSSDYFDFIEYNLTDDGDGKVLSLIPTKKRHYQNSFGTAIHYDDFYKGSLLIQAKRRDLFQLQDQLQLDLVIGNRIRYDLDYYINRGNQLNPGFRSRFQYNDVPTKLNNPLSIDSSFMIDELIFQYTDFSNEINVSSFKEENSMVEFALGLVKFKVDSDQLEDNMEENVRFDDSWYLKLESRYYYDNLDSKQFPLTGKRIKAKAGILRPIQSSIPTIDKRIGFNLEAEGIIYHPINEHISLGAEVLAGINIGEAYAPLLYNFGSASQNLINNFKPLPGLSFGQAIGESALKLSPFIRSNFKKNIYITGTLNVLWIGGPFDDIITSQRNIIGGSVGLGYSSILGPIEFIYGVADNEAEYYVNVGYWF
jgi:NTE family protein